MNKIITSLNKTNSTNDFSWTAIDVRNFKHNVRANVPKQLREISYYEIDE